jgi:hypothetical protein
MDFPVGEEPLSRTIHHRKNATDTTQKETTRKFPTDISATTYLLISVFFRFAFLPFLGDSHLLEKRLT